VIPILTREQSRQLDQELIQGRGIPSLILMENAGRGAADVIVSEFPNAAQLLVVCGRGNNGGDGFVVARRWLTMGRRAVVCLVGAEAALSAEARAQLGAYVAVGGKVVSFDEERWSESLAQSDVVVDALFGTGLTRPLEGVHAEAVRRINAVQQPVVALDLPSGLDANTGQTLGECVRATLTVTFGHPKRGCFTFSGASMVGTLRSVDVGAPLPVARASGRLAFAASQLDVQERLHQRAPVGHKGQAGHVLVIAGSTGTVGAARLAAHGAFRTGAGVVTIATHPDVAPALASDTWEVMVRGVGPDYSSGLSDLVERADSIVFGPGLGLSAIAEGWLAAVVSHFSGTLVIDADGLTLLSRNPSILEASRGKRVLTPHPGEAGRLLNCSAAAIEADRFSALESLCTRLEATVVLKGAPSLLGDREATYVAPRGHACLSTAGSGDVLAGVIGALSTHLPALDAALVGTWLHATAGERLGGPFAGRGLLAREIADEVARLSAALVGQQA
jgi:ADP-dependent NAD(P)H-hydrate dehydratase / NAD(P)H-hydrate epimerase